MTVTKATKQKDAAGLGALAYAHCNGDASALRAVADRHSVKIVASALKRSQDFFAWALRQRMTEQSSAVVQVAQRYLPSATWQWDKACLIAGAYLAVTAETPSLTQEIETQCDEEFPYWVALDKHTDEGKLALRDVAKKVGVSSRQLSWVSFYCESAYVNQLLPSPWFEAERTWRLALVGITAATASELWSYAKPLLRERLASDVQELKRTLQSPSQVRPQPLFL